MTSPSPPAAILLLGAFFLPAAAPAEGGAPPWIGVGVAAGAVAPDPHLADYRWDAGTRPFLGAEALAGWRALSGGLRVSTWETSQSLGGAAPDPGVRLTGVELVGRLRLLALGGFSLHGLGSAGRVTVAYRPDRAVIELPGGEPLPVAFDREEEWIAGLGLAAEHRLPGPLAVGAGIERSTFALDTAHREGNAVVRERESFHTWSLKLRLFWKLRTL